MKQNSLKKFKLQSLLLIGQICFVSGLYPHVYWVNIGKYFRGRVLRRFENHCLIPILLPVLAVGEMESLSSCSLPMPPGIPNCFVSMMWYALCLHAPFYRQAEAERG